MIGTYLDDGFCLRNVFPIFYSDLLTLKGFSLCFLFCLILRCGYYLGPLVVFQHAQNLISPTLPVCLIRYLIVVTNA